MGEEERGKAPPIWDAEGNEDIEGIEEVGSIGGSHRKTNKEERWRRCSDIWERGRQHREA
jgi:hypothetical protein